MRWSAVVLGVVIGVAVLGLIEFRGDNVGAKPVRSGPSQLALEGMESSADDAASDDQGLGSPVAEAAARVGGTPPKTSTRAPTDALGQSHSLPAEMGASKPLLLIETGPPVRPGRTPGTTSEGRAETVQAVPPVDDRLDASTQPGPVLAKSVLDLFSGEHAEVLEDLAGEEGFSREDLLAMYGRSSAAVGRFAHSAVGYAAFLADYGTKHKYSAEIALRLAKSLAPLNVDSVEIDHTPEGPVYRPRWRMGFEPGTEQLRLALPAYASAAELAEDEVRAGQALLMRGWVCRALGDWEASTSAWDDCAAACPGTEVAHQALRFAAQNLEWTDQPAAAAERVKLIAHTCTDAARVERALARVEDLEAQAARREQDWLADPSAALEAEVKRRADMLPAAQVYKSVLRWLQRRGERAACVEVGIWACGQADWPNAARINAHHDLVTSLLSGTPSPDDRRVAAKVLDGIVDLSDDDATAVRAALRSCRLLRELGSYEEAEQALNSVEDRAAGSFRWEPSSLSARARTLLAQGDRAGATQVLADLRDSYPDYELAGELGDVLNGTPDEEE